MTCGALGVRVGDSGARWCALVTRSHAAHCVAALFSSEAGRQGGTVYLHLVCLWDEHGKDVKKRIWQSDKEGKKAKYVVLGIELRDGNLRKNATKKHQQSA